MKEFFTCLFYFSMLPKVKAASEIYVISRKMRQCTKQHPSCAGIVNFKSLRMINKNIRLVTTEY